MGGAGCYAGGDASLYSLCTGWPVNEAVFNKENAAGRYKLHAEVLAGNVVLK